MSQRRAEVLSRHGLGVHYRIQESLDFYVVSGLQGAAVILVFTETDSAAEHNPQPHRPPSPRSPVASS